MRCLIDGRVFLDRFPGGVTRVAEALIPAMMEVGGQDEFVLATTGVGVGARSSHPLIDPGTGERTSPLRGSIHRSVPNKFVAFATWTRLTSFDRLIPGNFDVMFLPNLEMVGRPKTPYVLLVHDLSFLIEPRWFSAKTRLWHRVARAKELIRGADALLAVSERTKEDLVRLLNVPAERIRRIPLGLTNSSPNPSSPEEGNSGVPLGPYFLLLGGNDPRKNAACAMKAFEELRKTVDVRLIVVGAGFKPALGVTYVPRPTDAALRELMRGAAALLYPSWYEGFGLPLHEAAAFGTPIIASTAGALPETAPMGTMFAPPFKPHLWVQAMRLAMERPVSTNSPLSTNWSDAGQLVIETLRRVAKIS